MFDEASPLSYGVIFMTLAVTLTGGSATICLVDRALADTTGLAVTLADRQAHCVALGLHQALAH